jgi:hypothetical protein
VLDKDLNSSFGARNGLPRYIEDSYAVHLLNVMLGGGMSSRFSDDQRRARFAMRSTGNATPTPDFCRCTATSPDQINDVIRLSVEEFGKPKSEPVGDAELSG